jgi:DNA-binding transcriptional ArsR family regulator
MARGNRGDTVFKALADRHRRRILDCVKDHALTTGQICSELPEIDRCTVMLHLGVLERAGLIIVRREGRFRWNHLNSEPIQAIYDRWISRFAGPSMDLLTRLKSDLEGGRSAPASAATSGRSTIGSHSGAEIG